MSCVSHTLAAVLMDLKYLAVQTSSQCVKNGRTAGYNPSMGALDS